jgi:hypothetical protein
MLLVFMPQFSNKYMFSENCTVVSIQLSRVASNGTIKINED